MKTRNIIGAILLITGTTLTLVMWFGIVVWLFFEGLRIPALLLLAISLILIGGFLLED